jgi:hypothetical protein
VCLQDNLQSELVRQLYRMDMIDELLAEGELMALRRKETAEMLAVSRLLAPSSMNDDLSSCFISRHSTRLGKSSARFERHTCGRGDGRACKRNPRLCTFALGFSCLDP